MRWPKVSPDLAARSVAWQKSFPGLASQVGEARRFLAGHLGGCPVADDALVCLSELATNAVIHSGSRLPGGSFEVRGGMNPAGRLRVEVTDQGGPWHPITDLSGQHGRGLLIVASLAADWGIHGDEGSRTAWLELGGS
jgi:anti-sigma regulatory factor (Ser/Thr protein kinase)